jgi:hypothetical protein
MFLQSDITKQYEKNNKKVSKVISRWFRGVQRVSRGFKGVIYELRSCIGICMFLKSVLTKQYENNNKKYLR